LEKVTHVLYKQTCICLTHSVSQSTQIMKMVVYLRKKSQYVITTALK